MGFAQGSFSRGFMRGFKDQREYRLAKDEEKRRNEYEESMRKAREADVEYKKFLMEQKKAKTASDIEAAHAMRAANEEVFPNYKGKQKTEVTPGMPSAVSSGLMDTEVVTTGSPDMSLEAVQAMIDQANKQKQHRENVALRQAQTEQSRRTADLTQENINLKKQQMRMAEEKDQEITRVITQYLAANYKNAYLYYQNSGEPKNAAGAEALFGLIRKDAQELKSDIDGYTKRIYELADMNDKFNKKMSLQKAEMGISDAQRDEIDAMILAKDVEMSAAVEALKTKRDELIAQKKRMGGDTREEAFVNPYQVAEDTRQIGANEGFYEDTREQMGTTVGNMGGPNSPFSRGEPFDPSSQ